MPAAALLLALSGCTKEKPVEAPVVEVAIGGWDASAPLAYEPPPAAEEPPPDPKSLTGRWEGVGEQDDGQVWDLAVNISTTRAGVCATAEYPTVPCRAQWLCTSELRGTIHAREHLIEDSAHRCIDNGTMTLRLGGDGVLDWTWSGGGQTAHARLRRAR